MHIIYPIFMLFRRVCMYKSADLGTILWAVRAARLRLYREEI